MKSPLVEDFGYLGIGENARAVLEGTYIPPQWTNAYAAMLLEQLKIPDRIRDDSLPAFIEMEQFVQGWRHAKECTTMGSAFLHFGHFKAGTRDPVIAEFKATMAHIPYAMGVLTSKVATCSGLRTAEKGRGLPSRDLLDDSVIQTRLQSK
jgi:hypothetical protein